MTQKLKITNARLSFPSLFQKSSYDLNGSSVEGKYEATFLIPKSDTKTIQEIKNGIKFVVQESKIKVPSDKICLKDGDEVEYPGYENCYSIKASSNKRITLINRAKEPVIEEDDLFYAGCYVNALISFWVQNNQYGKRVNANLLGVQFYKDGEPFGMGNINVTEEFEDYDDDYDI